MLNKIGPSDYNVNKQVAWTASRLGQAATSMVEDWDKR
jgi:hypothetical protein